MPSARFQSTADGSKPKPRRNNQTSRSLPVSKSTHVMITAVPKEDHSKSSSSFSDSKQFVCSTSKCVFHANHDACHNKSPEGSKKQKFFIFFYVAMIQVPHRLEQLKPVDQKSHTQKPGRQIFTGHRFSPNKIKAVYEKTILLGSDIRGNPHRRIFKSVGLRWIPTGKFNSNLAQARLTEEPLLVQCTLCDVNKENLRVWLLKKLISQKPLSKWIHR
ncbi:hypothetical protein Tco_1263962 [Tanacetum coccineum]